MADELLGVAVCDECGSRIRVPARLSSLIGKAVRCPKCSTRFTLVLEEASQSDRIAVESQQRSEAANRRKRRSKSQIRDEHTARALEGFRALHERLKSISDDPNSSEEQVRVWCLDALRTGLGYEDGQIDTECKVLGGRVDIAIKEQGEVRMVIECKNIRSRLQNPVRDQAGAYAATLSATWAVVTNGDIWKLYRVTPRKGASPRMDLVFDVGLLDEDGISERDAENLYLLSHRGLQTGDIEAEYHQVCCTSPHRLYEALHTERVLSAIRVQLTQAYKDETGEAVKLEDEQAEIALRDLLTPLEFGT